MARDGDTVRAEGYDCGEFEREQEDRFSAQKSLRGLPAREPREARVQQSREGSGKFPCIKACGLMSWLLGSKGTTAPLKWAGQTELLQVLWH